MKIVHGKVNTYKSHGCRCDLCCDAGSEWMRDYYRRTEGLTKMVRTGEPMKKGSQGGPTGNSVIVDGSGPRGHRKNVSRTAGPVLNRKQKPKVVDFEPDSTD